jgi:hypothetical protein
VGLVLALGWLAVRLPAAWQDAAGLAADWRQARLAAMAPDDRARAADVSGIAVASVTPRRLPTAPAETEAVARSVPFQAGPGCAEVPDAGAPPGSLVVAKIVVAAPQLPPLPPLGDSAPLRPPEALAARFQPRSLPAVPDILLDYPDREPPSAEAFALASAAYAKLGNGERRRAARLFEAALLAGPHPNAAAWTAQRRQLSQRWSGDVYTLTRAPGPVSAAAAPLLGGGQSGSTLAFALNPLGKRRLSVVVRNTAANDAPTLTGQAAVGLRWQLRPGLSISAERLVALGPLARNGWTLRVAGGLAGRVVPRLARRSVPVEWQVYGEAGVIDDGNGYGGVEARAAVPLLRLGKGRLLAGGGAWGGAQTGIEAAYRVDVGPSLSWQRPVGRSTLTINADWRFRVTGNAFPESGPALTVAASF